MVSIPQGSSLVIAVPLVSAAAVRLQLGRAVAGIRRAGGR